MAKELRKGTKVEWKTSQGKTSGGVVKEVTTPTKVEGHVANAIRDDPQFVVESDKTGKKAVHKPRALKRK